MKKNPSDSVSPSPDNHTETNCGTPRDSSRSSHPAPPTSDSEDHCCAPAGTPDRRSISPYAAPILSAVLMVAGLVWDAYGWPVSASVWRLPFYLLAYLPVGLPVLRSAWRGILRAEVFTEFTLMSLATLGAFVLGEYPEGVGVMLFYAVGELFQGAAVKRARGSIRALLEARPAKARVHRASGFVELRPEEVRVGERLRVLAGEMVPLDGRLLSPQASLNTAALTGESRPRCLLQGEQVFAGSINQEGVIDFEATRPYADSEVARILGLVQDAAGRKSKTEHFIRRFARIYTPLVTAMAAAVIGLPYFLDPHYEFADWLYRGLVFLVVSCPCALVISIPLGYFGGLGAASRQGILLKGAVYLDAIARVNTLVLDKTGTVTRGVFRVQDIHIQGVTEADFWEDLIALEAQSTHPIARAILSERPRVAGIAAEQVTEFPGQGLSGLVRGRNVLAGNRTLLERHGIAVPESTLVDGGTEVLMAVDGVYAGRLTLADELKEDAISSVAALRHYGIRQIHMLSGDAEVATQAAARQLGLNRAMGGLLPEGKLHALEAWKAEPGTRLAFVGDGINDAPALAASDVGIALGALGSDAAAETADVVIRSDQLCLLVRAFRIARATRMVVWQNIGLALGVKAVVLVLGAGGLASLWEAVFADVGVALLAILNAVRIQWMRWGS